MNNIFIYTPDGTGIRNYLYSDVFKNRADHLTLLHSFENDVVELLEEATTVQASLRLPDFRERIKEKFYREAIQLARLYHNRNLKKNDSLLTNYSPKRNTIKQRFFYKLVEWYAQKNTDYDDILRLEKSYHNSIKSNLFYDKVKKILSSKKVDKIFLTHQRALNAPYVMSAARELGIECITVIYSWDNLPKARLYLKADKYLVWSDFMKQEMQDYYPEIDVDKVYVTGTPQFSFYQDKNLIQDRVQFANLYGLDPTKKWVCYSGDDLLTSPNDPVYLRDLAESILNSDLKSTCQILLRRCPVDNSGRFLSVIEDFKDLIIPVDPLWLNSGNWSSVFPRKEDIGLLVNTCFHCDIVFNIGSTMAFDFLQFKKPCVYINYDVPGTTDWSVNTIYNFQHFRSMPSKQAVIWLDDKKEIKIILNNLQKGDYNIEQTQKWFDKIVAHSYETTEVIYQTIIK